MRHSAFNIQHDRMLCTMPPASVCRFILINSKDAGENSEPRPWITFAKSGLPSIETYSTFLQKNRRWELGSRFTLRRVCRKFSAMNKRKVWTYLANKRPGEEAKWANSIASVAPLQLCPDNHKWETNFPDSTKNLRMYSKLRYNPQRVPPLASHMYIEQGTATVFPIPSGPERMHALRAGFPQLIRRVGS